MSNEPYIPLVLALDDASATLEQVGGKGALLAHMAAAGLSVPRGLHVTTGAYRRFVTENVLQEKILAARITTPAWTPLLGLAAESLPIWAVHSVKVRLWPASIIFWLFWEPERLGSGQRITVDGDAGTVTASS